MRKRNNTVRVYNFIIVIVLFLFSIIAFKFFYVAYTNKSGNINLKKFAASRDTYKSVIPANRGTIYDVTGEILAQDINSYNVIAYLDSSRTTDPKKLKHVADKEMTAEKLSPIINMDKEQILKLLNKKSYQVELGPGGRNITELKKEEIEALNLPGIDFLKSSKRYYKMGSFASYVIGYAKKNDDNEIVGELGIERQFNDTLKGKDGYIEYQRDAYGYQIPNTPSITEDPVNGSDIYLTIDTNIQMLLENKLEELKNTAGYTWATFTVADAKTGAIVGTASNPNFDLNTLDNVTSYLNPLTQYTYEPGSTMKTYTWMATLENGLYNGEETLQSGRVNIGEDVITDFNEVGFGTITFDRGFAYSSNVAATKLSQKLGRKNLHDYFELMGFGSKTGIELPGESSGDINFRYPIEVATAAFGQGITTTPIQNIQALTSITNDGVMLKPYLIDKIVDEKGKTIKVGKRKEIKTVASKTTTDKMKNLMKDVVYSGLTSAKFYQTDNVTLIGKTGTAEIPNPNGGGYMKGENNYIRSFAGIFPYDDPKYILYISVKQLNGSVSNMANSVKSVVEEISNYKNITETKSALDESKIIKVKSYISKNINDARDDINLQMLVPVIIGDGDKVVNQYPKKNVTIVASDKVFLKTNYNKVTLPDMTGWSISDAKVFCKMANLNCEIEGNGRVISTSIPKDSVLNLNETLKITASK